MLTVLTAPLTEPVTLDEAKLHLRIGSVGSGGKISGAIGTNQYLTSVSVLAGGSQYPQTTTATCVGGTTGSAATLTLTIAASNGTITGASIASSGNGYTSPPVIVLSSGDFGIEDTLIENLIVCAREEAEHATQRQCMSASYLYSTSVIEYDPVRGNHVKLPKPPLISVESVNYYDSAGNVQTTSAADYQVVIDEPAYVRFITTPGYDTSRPDGLGVRFTCGYASAATVPQMIKQAMLLGVGAGYSNREDADSVLRGTSVVQSTVERLLNKKRVWGVGT